MSRVRTWIESIGQRSLERAVVKAPPAAQSPAVLGPKYRVDTARVYKPPERTARNALTAFEGNPFVYVVVDRVASKFAGQGWYLKKRRSDDGKKIFDHPALSFLLSGSEVMDGFQTRRMLCAHLDLAGESFLLKGYDSSGRAASYLPLPANWVTQPAYKPGEFFDVQIPSTGFMAKVPYEGMIWLKRPRPSDPIGRGYAATQALLTEINLHDEIASFFYNFVKNRARPDIIVTGTTEDPLLADDARAMEQRWLQNHGGPSNAGKPLFSNAPLEVHELGQTMQESQLVEMRKLGRDFILQVYGVQPSVFGIIENANRATAEAADFTMARDVLEPRMKAHAEAMYPILVQEFPDLVRYELHFDSPVAEDKEFRLNVIRAAPSAFRVRDVRSLGGFEPDTEFDDERLQEANVDLGGSENGDPNALDDGNTDSPNKALRAATVPLLSVRRDLTDEQIDRLTAGLDDNEESLTLILLGALRAGAVQAMVDLAQGRGAQVDTLLAELESWAETRASELLGFLNETSAAAIKSAVQIAGDDRAVIGGVILALFAEWGRDRAALIATTEASGAMSKAETAIGRAIGATGKVWLTQADERVRSLHRPMHGQTRNLDEPFEAPNGERGQGPGLFASASMNVNCLLGDSSMIAIGAIKKGYRRTYEGPIVTIKTADGSELSGTPNHPVLTDRGWVGLAEIVNGDNVVCCKVVGSLTTSEMQNPNKAPNIGDVVRLAEVSGKIERVLGSAPQFHGDGRDGEVDIVSLNGELSDRLESKLAELGLKLSLSGADIESALLASDGKLVALVRSVLASPGCVMSGSGKPASLGCGRKGHSIEHGLGAASGLDVEHLEVSADDISVDAVVSSKAENACPISIAMSKVVEIKIVTHDTPVDVFNVETESGAYVSCGMIVSNCRCGTRSFSGNPPSAADLAAMSAAHDRSHTYVETVMASGIRSLFQRQQSAILSRLGSIR